MDRGVRLGDDHYDYNHATDSEYKRLRDEADRLYKKRLDLSHQSQQAYKSGDKAKAKQLSDELKQVAEEAEEKNIQAAEYVFRENNADSAEDEIDLHGLFVNEAEFILQRRIGEAIRTNQSHLRVIVGKGLHSQNGIAKLKPAVDQMCDDAKLNHHIDPKNTGVLVIDLSNTQSSQLPSNWAGPKPSGNVHHQPYAQQQPQYQQNHQQSSQGNQQGNDDIVVTIVKLICACFNSK
jgi:DNA-nicking Smr family endonuclease